MVAMQLQELTHAEELKTLVFVSGSSVGRHEQSSKHSKWLLPSMWQHCNLYGSRAGGTHILMQQSTYWMDPSSKGN